MKNIKKATKALMFYVAVFCPAFSMAANREGNQEVPVQEQSQKNGIHPVDQFRSLCEMGDFFEAIQFFQKSIMHYKIMLVYDFIKKPSNSEELDFLFLDYLKEANEIDDQGSETQDARFGSMAKLFDYFSKKYDIPLAPPSVDPRRRDPPWVIKRMFAAGILTLEKTLEARLPEQDRKSAGPAAQAEDSVISALNPGSGVENGTGGSSAPERAPSSRWTLLLALIAGASVVIPSIRFLRSKYRRGS